MVEFIIDTNEVKFMPTEVGLYLRHKTNHNYICVRLPITTVWSSIHDTTLKKIKIDEKIFEDFNLKQFIKKVNN